MKRPEGMAFDEYKRRLRNANGLIKRYLREGVTFWNSASAGTYRKNDYKHGRSSAR